MKLLIIGLDGATFDVILPMINQGKLPNLSRLINNGVYSRMKSVYPPVTFPAWTSFKTGKQPTKHGVFGFVGGYPYISDTAKVIFSTDVKEKTFWKILSEAGYTVGVVNVPTTYPPEKVKGLMISGLGTPSLDSNFVYPKHLRKVLQSLGYMLDTPRFSPNNKTGFIKELKEATNRITRAVCYFLTNYDFDFFMVNFMAVDLVQHFFWGYMDSEHPLYFSEDGERYRHTVEEIYQLVDYCIGEILSCANPKNVFIVSDHGFGPAHKEVYLNELFVKHGLLSIKQSKKRMFNVGSIILNLSKIQILRKVFCNRIFPDFIKRLLKQKTLSAGSDVDLIDWSNTIVYSGGYFGRIYINLKGREKLGIVNLEDYEKILKKVENLLNSWIDPDTGEKIVDAIFRKEEIYPKGKYFHLAPDLTIIMKNMSYVDYPGFREGKIFYPPRRSGDHRIHGIFIGCGEDILSGGLKHDTISICDIAPTVLRMYGINPPGDLDGHVLEIFKHDSGSRCNWSREAYLIRKCVDKLKLHKNTKESRKTGGV